MDEFRGPVARPSLRQGVRGNETGKAHRPEVEPGVQPRNGGAEALDVELLGAIERCRVEVLVFAHGSRRCLGFPRPKPVHRDRAREHEADGFVRGGETRRHGNEAGGSVGIHPVREDRHRLGPGGEDRGQVKDEGGVRYCRRSLSHRVGSRMSPSKCFRWRRPGPAVDSGRRSTVTTGSPGPSASRCRRAWPISPAAPVISVTGTRSAAHGESIASGRRGSQHAPQEDPDVPDFRLRHLVRHRVLVVFHGPSRLREGPETHAGEVDRDQRVERAVGLEDGRGRLRRRRHAIRDREVGGERHHPGRPDGWFARGAGAGGGLEDDRSPLGESGEDQALGWHSPPGLPVHQGAQAGDRFRELLAVDAGVALDGFDVEPGAHLHAAVDGHRTEGGFGEQEPDPERGGQPQRRNDGFEVVPVGAESVEPDDGGAVRPGRWRLHDAPRGRRRGSRVGPGVRLRFGEMAQNCSSRTVSRTSR